MAGENVKEFFNDCTIRREINHERGYWDGGYDDAELDMVGVGWHIQFREQLPLTNDNLWMPLMHGYGKCQGKSAAAQSLIHCLNPTSSNIQLSAWDWAYDDEEGMITPPNKRQRNPAFSGA